MRFVLEPITSRWSDGDGRRGLIAFVAALAVFVAAVMFSSSSAAYGAPEVKKPPSRAANKEPKVEASVRRGEAAFNLKVPFGAGMERLARNPADVSCRTSAQSK